MVSCRGCERTLPLITYVGPCLDSRDANCKSVKVSGYYTPGTFQQYVLAPANYVTPIPDGVSDIEAAPVSTYDSEYYDGADEDYSFFALE